MENPRQFNTLFLYHILERHNNNTEDYLQNSKGFSRRYIELPDFDGSYLSQYRKDAGLSLIYTDDDHISEFDRYELDALLTKSHKSEYYYGVQKFW